MKFELTKHAEDVILERKIPIDYIERVLDNPELKEIDANDMELTHYLLKIPENDNRVLRVIVNIKHIPTLVITAYYDRTMRGKL